LALGGAIHRGRALSASGDTAEGIQWIEHGIRDIRTTDTVPGMPYALVRKAEALHLANRTSQALEAINEAEVLSEAIRIAKEQKSVSLEKRAEGTYAEYRKQKASATRGRGFRLPL
jgi:hypothetical protein